MAIVQRKSKGKIAFDIINYVLLTLIALVCVMPIWHVMMASLSAPADLQLNKNLILWPLGQSTLKGYELVFENPSIMVGYKNTIIYVVLQTALGILCTIIAGYILAHKTFVFKGLLMFLITFTMMFSGGLIPTYMVIKNLGWIDSRLALIIPGCMNAFNIIIMRTSIQGIPDSLEESAKLDGAGDLTILFRIIIPLDKATIAVLILFMAVAQWNSWFNAMIYLKSRKLFPLQLILREILIQNDVTQVFYGADAASRTDIYKPLVRYCTTIVATLPILCIYPFIQKYFVSGVMIGSLKG